ncbi:MAG TPA: hypothetical protein VGC64_10955 [Pyrinomonadaceae bacterium]|jgi:hypothetical protein
MDEESGGGRKPSSIKPPMIKPPMAAPGATPPSPQQQSRQPVAFHSTAQPTVDNQPSPPQAEASSGKLMLVINIILTIALIVGLIILAYRWLR